MRRELGDPSRSQALLIGRKTPEPFSNLMGKVRELSRSYAVTLTLCSNSRDSETDMAKATNSY